MLHKRENFRKAFDDFDFWKVAKFTVRDKKRLSTDSGIIRNQAKIVAAINNAKRFLQVRQEFGTFAKYMWSWVDGKPIINRLSRLKDYKPYSDKAVVWAKDLKERGFKFLGPTVIYSHMQASGMVNDHIQSCFRYKELCNNK